MTYLIAAMVALAGVEVLCVWRALVMTRAVPRLEDRIDRLTRTVELLTDTTESCFNVVAARLPADQTAAVPRRDTRQRRIVAAAKRGHSVNQIAAREAVSESEVELRLHLAHEPSVNGDGGDHAEMCS